MKLRLNKLRERLRQNRGHLVVESTFVYPLMFFVLFFLMFLGNMFYLRARIDSMVTQEAIRYAAEYANPNLAAFEEEIPTTVEGKELTKDLYRYINIFSKEENLDTELSDRIGETSGYFTGMNPDNIVIKEYRAKNYVIYQSYVVEVTYELKTPIKFLFDDDYLTLDMTARAEVPVTDTAEFIRNVDMAVDLVERTEAGTKLTEKINDTYAKVDEFLNGEGGASGDNGAVAGGATGGTTGTGARYGEQKITKEEYKKLRDHSPTDEIRDMVNEGIEFPIPDPALPGLMADKFEADHIVSMKNIVRMEGFEKLTYEQQLEVLNNPINFVGLSKSANTSKQNKTYEQWTHYKKGSSEEIEVDKAFRAEMMAKEKSIEGQLQKQIDDLVAKNQAGGN